MRQSSRCAWLLFAVACVGDTTAGPEPADSAPGVVSPTATVPGPTTVTAAPDPTESCGPLADLYVESFTVEPGRITTQAVFTVTTSAPAQVAVQCTHDDDPEEVFFVESATDDTTHTLRMSGLMGASTYSCSAAPVCPRMLHGASTLPLETDLPPGELRRLAVEAHPTLAMEGAWTLAPYTLVPFFTTSYIVVWGPDGEPRWWRPLPSGVGVWVEALYHPDTDEIVWGGGMSPEGRPHVVDMWEGDTYVWSPPGWQSEFFHHDGKRLDDGRLMTLERRENESGHDHFDGFGIRIHDPATGVVDFDLDSQRLVDAGVLDAPAFPWIEDPWHANWVDWIEPPEGPEVVVSLCFSWEIVAIDATTGDARWVLGRDRGWTVLDENGDPMPEGVLPQCQHGLEVDDQRNILLYDNGQARDRTGAQEWHVDPATRTVQLLWSWTEPDLSEDFLGDIDHLGSDRVLVTAAPSQIIEVDRPTGEVVSRMTFDDGGTTYRSERYAGCDLFDSVRYCDDLSTRYAEVESVLRP